MSGIEIDKDGILTIKKKKGANNDEEARKAGITQTQSKGSGYYTPFESQTRNENIIHKSYDCWSLAVMLYMIMYNRTPFDL